jgi:large subunit ribosomal protein L29
MKAIELRNLTVDDLRSKSIELREDYFKLRFKHGIRHLENPAKLCLIRKNIARIQTVLEEKSKE